MQSDHQPTLTERIAKIEAVIFHNGSPMQDEGDVYALDKGEVERIKFGNTRYTDVEDQAKVVSSYEEIMNRVQSCTDRVCLTASKLEEIGNRIFGHLPEGDSERSQPHRSPEGTFEHTLLALDWLDESLMRLQRATTRIERV